MLFAFVSFVLCFFAASMCAEQWRGPAMHLPICFPDQLHVFLYSPHITKYSNTYLTSGINISLKNKWIACTCKNAISIHARAVYCSVQNCPNMCKWTYSPRVRKTSQHGSTAVCKVFAQSGKVFAIHTFVANSKTIKTAQHFKLHLFINENSCGFVWQHIVVAKFGLAIYVLYRQIFGRLSRAKNFPDRVHKSFLRHICSKSV